MFAEYLWFAIVFDQYSQHMPTCDGYTVVSCYVSYAITLKLYSTCFFHVLQQYLA